MKIRIAVKAGAGPPINEPKTEMVWPIQTRMKSALRQS